jgi:predicted ATPase
MEILFTDSEVLLIEEPESNLHPALQSKLAVFFVELANKYNKQIIIETHSEYIIRKIQYVVILVH